MTKYNEHYWLRGRNGWTPTNTWQDEVIKDKDDKWSGGNINPYAAFFSFSRLMILFTTLSIKFIVFVCAPPSVFLL